MANAIFQQLNRGGQQAGGNMLQSFQNFMTAYRGQDPNALIQQAVSSGRINQEQLNIIQQRAGQIAGMLDGIKCQFGF